jgi:hypothetical protein
MDDFQLGRSQTQLARGDREGEREGDREAAMASVSSFRQLA